MSVDKKEIVSAVDISLAIGRRMKLKKKGDNYEGLCPFHNERTPSFNVSPAKKIFKCFGCGRSGDVIKFVELFDHVDFQEAISRLASENNISDPHEAKEKAKVYELPEPRTDSLAPDLAELLTKVRRISPATLSALGITGSTEYIVQAKDKIPVICFNYFKAGKLVNIKFRGKLKYMQLVKGCQLIPYNLDAIKGSKVVECAITEGEIDCATLVECGYYESTSVPNGAAGSIDWVGKFYDKKNKIILFTDDDDPGNLLREKLTKRLGYNRCYYVKYPDGCKDINEVFVKQGHDAVKAVYESAYVAPLPAPAVAESSQLEITENPDASLSIHIVNANGSITYKVNLPGVIKWAVALGFAWIKYSEAEDAPVMLVRLSENIIYPVTEQDLLHEFTHEIDLNYSDDPSERRALYSFSSMFTRFMPLLPYFDKPILSDKRDTAHIFFTNGTLEITAKGSRFLSYAETDGYIWSRYIIPHEYSPSSSDGTFKEFLRAVSVDDQHYEAILSAIGYVLHSYKLRTEAKAVIVVEDVDDESEARGRSGKGLIAQFVELFKNVVQQDGRNYKSDDKFKLQRVDISTQVFYLNDPPAGLLLNQFYNMITDDFLVEMKGKSSYTIPFKRSPKLLVTTNHLPALTSDSDKDRFAVVSIKKTFGTTETISSRFPGTLFFDADHWAKSEFAAAFSLAVDAITVWLTKGLISYRTAEMAANESKRLIGAVVPDYVSEVLDQVVPLAQIHTDVFEFEKSLKHIDLDPYGNSLAQCFSWTPTELEVHLTHYYRYAISMYKAKVNQVWFSRKVIFYLEHSSLRFKYLKPNRMPRKLVIYLSGSGNSENSGSGLISPQDLHF